MLGRNSQLDGRVIVEAADGGLLFQSRDGVLHRFTPKQRVRRTSDDTPFTPLSQDELATQLLAELPDGFEVHKTAHYLIVHNSSRAYAKWCGALFERLYLGFSNYWKRRGFDLQEPEFPLVAVVFGDWRSYQRHAQREIGPGAESIIGYYHLETNRMTMCDLTGVSGAAKGQRIRSAAQINAILSRPKAAMTVTTIVHEATHQIAYNRGLHTRLSDCPLWLCEGLAVFFETPDLRSSKGWAGIGELNRERYVRFAHYSMRRPANSLATLIGRDNRFRDAKTTEDAYAEAWALTYFLIRKHKDKYIEYLKKVSRKKPLIWGSAAERIEEFEAVFGDLEKLDREFLRYFQKMR